ncbi:hypothetical protein [Candidatus Mycoplasma haematohominis]|uniref:Uncharacterized protein n=1 Tax=Candidatus Mycoplasma haematohominis TaxID=1494318 RepID=A0A478FR37_9MOLU|nr:hypothetical protein [Candidatus Mycoplasma haemohominis]GCE64058.1 hypothetical protein MHSWG343_10660 [Candidatus Mycoplasma haemohominis]
MNILQLAGTIVGGVALTSTIAAGAYFGGVFSNSRADIEDEENLKPILAWTCEVIKKNEGKFSENFDNRGAKALCSELGNHLGGDLKNFSLTGKELANRISGLKSVFFKTAIWSAITLNCLLNEVSAEGLNGEDPLPEIDFVANDICQYAPELDNREELKQEIKEILEKAKAAETEEKTELSAGSGIG